MLVSCIWMPLVRKWRLEANIVHICRRLVALPNLPDASGEPRDFPEHSSSVPFHFCILRRWGNRLLSYALLAIVMMHVLRPDYTPINHMISDYAVGRFGWIMTTAFVALACGILMLLAGLARCGPASALARVGMFFLGVPCIGLIVTAIYPTDLEEATSATRSGNIHTISFLVNVVSILLAVALLSASFRSHPAWRNHQRTAIALASLVVLAFIFQFLTLHRGAPYGIANRLFVSSLFAWLLTTSIHLLKVARQ